MSNKTTRPRHPGSVPFRSPPLSFAALKSPLSTEDENDCIIVIFDTITPNPIWRKGKLISLIEAATRTHPVSSQILVLAWRSNYIHVQRAVTYIGSRGFCSPSRPMHRLFAVSDVLVHICEILLVEDGDRASVARLARTTKALSAPCFAVLWRKLDCLYPLLNALPSSAVDLSSRWVRLFYYTIFTVS